MTSVHRALRTTLVHTACCINVLSDLSLQPLCQRLGDKDTAIGGPSAHLSILKFMSWTHRHLESSLRKKVPQNFRFQAPPESSGFALPTAEKPSCEGACSWPCLPGRWKGTEAGWRASSTSCRVLEPPPVLSPADPILTNHSSPAPAASLLLPNFQSFWSHHADAHTPASAEIILVLPSRADHRRPRGQAPFPPIHGIYSDPNSSRSESLWGVPGA